MYSQRQKRTNTYCPVSHKAGKDISVYQSHNINEGNKVVCPLLLSQKCNYCGEVGHFFKYCPARNKGDQPIYMRNNTQNSQPIRQQIGMVALGGRFDDKTQYVSGNPVPQRKRAPSTDKNKSSKSKSQFPFPLGGPD